VTSDTIYALSSGRPPAAVSVIRVSGPLAHEAGRKLAGRLPRARQAGLRTLRGSDCGVLDEALVLRFNAPASATGEDIVELQCHGGRAIVDAILSELARIEGLRSAVPGEFTRRAFENGRIDLTEAEGLADLAGSLNSPVGASRGSDRLRRGRCIRPRPRGRLRGASA
jgi:tRNA modification GTPase